jgi:hypothetical protein
MYVFTWKDDRVVGKNKLKYNVIDYLPLMRLSLGACNIANIILFIL